MTEPTSLSEHQTQLQATLIETLRDIWPLQKGLDALLFQNDLFYRLKRLEDIAEGVDNGSTGFLSGDSWDMYSPSAEETHTFTGGRDAYLKVWTSIDAACGAGDWTFVDSTEDLVVAWCTDMIPERIAFFEAALESGSLDDAWMEKAELLREAHEPVKEETDVPEKPLENPVSVPEPVPEPVIALRPKSHPTRRRHERLFTPTRARPRVRNTRRH